MKLETVINFGDMQIKRRFLAQAGALNDPHEVKIKPWKPRRKNEANRFYFGVVVAALVQFMEEQGDIWTPDQAHDLIARNCLGERSAVMRSTGEVIGTVRKETHILNKDEFSEYIDRSIAWLASFGIAVPEYERDSSRRIGYDKRASNGAETPAGPEHKQPIKEVAHV